MDGTLDYPICFKADFGSDRHVTLHYENLLSDVATIKINGFGDVSSSTNFIIGGSWKFDITDRVHPKYVEGEHDFEKYCDYQIYDPYLACAGETTIYPFTTSFVSDNKEFCELTGKSTAERPLGLLDNVFCGSDYCSNDIAAPRVREYYFATSYNIWGTAMIPSEELCAKWIPMDCATGAFMPILPLLEDKLLAISQGAGEKLALVSLLTGGASDVVINSLTGSFSGARSTNDLTNAIVEKLTGTDMLAFNKKIDPSIILGKVDPTALLGIVEKESMLKGELEAIKSLIDPLGILSTISGLNADNKVNVVEHLLNLLKSETSSLF